MVIFQNWVKRDAPAELPHPHQDDDEQGGVGVAQQRELLLDAKDFQQAHQDALVAEDLLPDHRDGDGAAHDGGDIVEHPVEGHAHVLFVQQGGHKEGEGQPQRHHDKDIAEGDGHGLAEIGVLGEDLDVVLQADPGGGGQKVIIGEGIVDGHDRRDQIHEDEPEQPGRQQQVAGAQVAATPQLMPGVGSRFRRCRHGADLLASLRLG